MGKWDGLSLVNGLGVFPVAVLPNPKIGIFGGLGLYPKMALFTRTWSLPHAIITHRQNTANLALCSKACYNQNKPMETPS